MVEYAHQKVKESQVEKREVCKEKLMVLKRRIKYDVNEGIKTIFGAFKCTSDQVEMICLSWTHRK